MSKEVPMVTITRSFGRKLNMSAHGGKQYETADLFISLTTEVPGNEIRESSAQLDKMCQKEIQKTIDAFDGEEEAAEETKTAKVTKKGKKATKVEEEIDEHEAIAEYINDLTMAKTSEELVKAVKKMQKNADEFTKAEKEYLAAYYAKRKAALAESSEDEDEDEEDEEDDEEDDE